MGEKEEEELKRYLLDSNVKILFEGKNPMPVEITEFPPAFSDRGWFMMYLYKEEWGELVIKDVSTDRKYLDVFSSPVIEFSRTVIREHAKEITPGGEACSSITTYLQPFKMGKVRNCVIFSIFYLIDLTWLRS